MATNCDDLDWTREEVNALKDAFKDKKFLQMFSEYAEEVTDPENVKKYENDVVAYERQHGNEAKFIHPESGYVLKTSVEGERKAFINICTNSNVEKPSCKNEITDDGGKGSRWRLPHFLTPPRDDLDKSQRRCVVYDVIFHPDTLKLSHVDRRFRKMINDIAIEEIESKFDVKLDKNNIRFPKMKYKGNPVSTITRKKLDTKDIPIDEDDDGLDDKVKELLKPPTRSYNYNKSNSHKKANTAQSNSDKNEDNTTWSTPKYSIKYRNHVDIQDYTNMPHQAVNTRPQEIVVEINLPLLNSASPLNLDISEKNLLLISEKKGANYRLDLSLAYPIDEKEGRAQFDKSKRTLTVTLKVLPATNNLDLIDDTPVFPEMNDAKLLDMSDLQNSLDVIDQCNKNENKEAVKLSKPTDDIESSNILLDCHFEEKSNIALNELAEKSDQESPLICPPISNVQDKFASELSEIMESMDENLHIKDAENMICEISTGINTSNDNCEIRDNGSNSIEYQDNLDALSEETENKFELHDCSKNIPSFLAVAYFPRFDYHQTSKTVTFLAQVKNIDPSSVQVCVCECRTNCWITFFTLGSGFVPFHYCLFLKFGSHLIAEGENAKIDISENNLVTHLIKDYSNYCTWTEFEAGLNDKSLQRYEFLCAENVMKAVQELKAESEAALNGDALLNEQVRIEDICEEQVVFDIKLKKVDEVPEHPLENVTEYIEEEAYEPSQYISSIERDENEFKETMLPPLSKVRTSSGSSEDQSPIQKRPGILKYPRYWRTVSESSDDMFWSSMDNEATPVGSLDSVGERPKKCVRFNDQVAKNVFRVNSSILGQRKKNQRKARNRRKIVNTKTNSDGTTETSEETSDCNSTSEYTSDISHTDTRNQKIYAKQQYKSVNEDMNLSENIYSDTMSGHTMGALNNETTNTYSINTSIYSQYPPTALNFSSEDIHSHTISDNVDMSTENSTQQVTNVKLYDTCKSVAKEPAFTIMQRPQQILPRQPSNLQQSEQPKTDFSFATNFKRTNTNPNKMSDNKVSRNNRSAFQRQDSVQGEAKQKGKRRRKWRNKNRARSTPVTSENYNNEPSYSILRSPNNFSDSEQFQSCEKREISVPGNEGGNPDRYDNMITENFNNNNNDNIGDVALDESCKETTLGEHSDVNHFWQCRNDAEADAKYRTNCIVDFTNELMFQLD